MDHLKAPRREVTWTALDIGQGKSSWSNLLSPKLSSSEDTPDLNDQWYVIYTEKRGLLQPKFFQKLFQNQEEAEEFYSKFKDGNYVYDHLRPQPPSESLVQSCREMLDSGNWSKFWSQNTLFGEPVVTHLAGGVLAHADITEDNESGSTAQSVLDYVGIDRVDELKRKFPKSWRYVVEMEYAALLFSQDSLVYIAAAARYCQFFSKEPLVAGYLIRDLELLSHGAELVFSSNALRTTQSAKKTRNVISENMKGRWETIIESMDKIIKSEIQKKSKKKWTELTLARAAAAERVSADDKHWRAGGKGSVANYLVF